MAATSERQPTSTAVCQMNLIVVVSAELFFPTFVKWRKASRVRLKAKSIVVDRLPFRH